jgi:hypothetical protein
MPLLPINNNINELIGSVVANTRVVNTNIDAYEGNEDVINNINSTTTIPKAAAISRNTTMPSSTKGENDDVFPIFVFPLLPPTFKLQRWESATSRDVPVIIHITFPSNEKESKQLKVSWS